MSRLIVERRNLFRGPGPPTGNRPSGRPRSRRREGFAVVAAVINSGCDPGTGHVPGAEWYRDDVEVAAVAVMLAGCGWLDSDRDLAIFRSEPWRWSAIRELWVRSGRPTAVDPDWELFVECLD